MGLLGLPNVKSGFGKAVPLSVQSELLSLRTWCALVNERRETLTLVNTPGLVLKVITGVPCASDVPPRSNRPMMVRALRSGGCRCALAGGTPCGRVGRRRGVRRCAASLPAELGGNLVI